MSNFKQLIVDHLVSVFGADSILSAAAIVSADAAMAETIAEMEEDGSLARVA